MNKIFKLTTIALLIGAVSACSRIETGQVGIRVDMNKQIQGAELMPGSWNQTVVGNVLTFPTKDITLQLDNKTPMTADNSALADFDMTIVYGINPTSVSELYSTKSKAFHFYDEKEKDTFLMFNYIGALVNNAAYKVIRKYTNLQVADARMQIEQEIKDSVQEQLKTEKLDAAISLTVVQVRNILPNAAILASATELVKSVNDLKIKENEIKIAEAEARRMQMLTSNAGQSIAYMNAQSLAMIAEGVKNGKVQSVVVPYDFKGLISVGK